MAQLQCVQFPVIRTRRLEEVLNSRVHFSLLGTRGYFSNTSIRGMVFSYELTRNRKPSERALTTRNPYGIQQSYQGVV